MSIPTNIFPDIPDAACIGHSQYFNGREKGENTTISSSITLPRHAVAKQICQTCPGLIKCRDWALAHFGDAHRRNGTPAVNGPVLGGLTDHERIQYRRQHHMPAPPPIDFKHLRICGHPNDGNGRGGACTECRNSAKQEDTRRRQQERYLLDVSSGKCGTRREGCRAGHPPEAMYQRLDKRHGRRCKMCETEYNQRRNERRRAKKQAAA